MLAIALDLPPLPMNGAALTTMQAQVAAPPDRDEIRLDLDACFYLPGSAVTADTTQVEHMNEPTASYEPKTAFGKRLLALRKAYLENGGKLLSPDELDAEMEARRGGLGDG